MGSYVGTQAGRVRLNWASSIAVYEVKIHSKRHRAAKRGPFLREMEKLHDEVVASFVGDDFLDDSKLSGEFLLGYHCQRQILNPPKADAATSDASDDESSAE